jgi:hypothetical protein
MCKTALTHQGEDRRKLKRERLGLHLVSQQAGKMMRKLHHTNKPARTKWRGIACWKQGMRGR